MIEDNKMGRRLSDLNASSDFVNLMLEIQQQSTMLRNMEEKVQELPQLTRKVDVLVSQMETISDEVDSIDNLKKLVDWHERLWKLIASVCMLLFPTILASVFWMWTQVSIMQSKQNILEFKLQYMEDRSGKAATDSNLGSGENELSWYLWNFEGSRFEDLLFHRTSVEEQSTQCELHPDRNLYVRL